MILGVLKEGRYTITLFSFHLCVLNKGHTVIKKVIFGNVTLFARFPMQSVLIKKRLCDMIRNVILMTFNTLLSKTGHDDILHVIYTSKVKRSLSFLYFPTTEHQGPDQ